MPSGVIHALAMTGAASWIKNEFATLGNHPESFMFFHNWTERVVQNVRCENCHAIKLSGCLFWQDRSNRLWSKKRKMALNFWSVTGLSQFNSLPAKGFQEKYSQTCGIQGYMWNRLNEFILCLSHDKSVPTVLLGSLGLYASSGRTTKKLIDFILRLFHFLPPPILSSLHLPSFPVLPL